MKGCHYNYCFFPPLKLESRGSSVVQCRCDWKLTLHLKIKLHLVSVVVSCFFLWKKDFIEKESALNNPIICSWNSEGEIRWMWFHKIIKKNTGLLINANLLSFVLEIKNVFACSHLCYSSDVKHAACRPKPVRLMNFKNTKKYKKT